MRRLITLATTVAAFVLTGTAAGAAELPLSVVSETDATITLGWTPPQGTTSYTFFVGGQRVSNSQDGTRSSVRFAKAPCDAQPDCYVVSAQTELARGGWKKKPVCSNGRDDDGDGRVDYPDDPGCTSASDTDETDPVPPNGQWLFCSDEWSFCSFTGTHEVRYGAGGTWLYKTATDGIDCSNDTWGDPLPGVEKHCDYLESGTTEPPPAACADGVDNDGDGLTDYPNDPGCASSSDTEETDEVTPPPPIGSASVFVAPTGSDSNPCTAVAPCASFGRAYRAANPGDIVEVRAGTYPNQSVSPDPSKTSSTDVVFRPAAGANVVVGGFDRWGASHTTVDGSTGNMVVHGFEVSDPASTANTVTDITFAHIDFRPGQSQVLNVNGLTLDDLDIGGNCNGNDALRFNDPVGTAGDTNDPENVVVKNSRIGRICWPSSSDHPDCVAMSAGHNVTFDSNRIWQCGSQGLYLISELGGHIHDVLIQNNMLGDCRTAGGYSQCVNSLILDVRSPGLLNITVRYNSFAVGQQPMRVSGGTSAQNIEVYGNAGEGPGCETVGTTYAYNVWDDAKCSSTDLQADPQFVSSASGDTFDLHLRSSSPAINHGDPARYPAADYDGQLRSQPPDAGADESG